MKVIRPYAKLINQSHPKPLQFIEWCGRISHRSEEAQTEDSWKRFVETVVLGHGDWSIVEHVSASVDSITDRGITHESVRHRLFSFTQESTRFVNYEKKMPPAFIYPKVDIECEFCLAPYFMDHSVNMCAYDSDWKDAIVFAEEAYKKLLLKGWRPQEARSVFPNALASRIVTTGNLRNWRHYFIMRTTNEAHPQMRQVTVPLLADFKAAFPILFDDILPLVKQSEGMKKAR